MKTGKKKKSILLSVLFGLLLGGGICLLLLGLFSGDPAPPSGVQIASSDEASPSSSQDLMEHLRFLDVPDNKKDPMKKAVASLLHKCPRIVQYATHGEVPSVSYYPRGWEGTPAHIEFDIDFTEESQSPFPQGMKDPQWSGHVGLGISGDNHPGIYMHSPLEMWICGVHLSYEMLGGVIRKWPDRVRFIPLGDVRPRSF